ncbi:MAG: glycosyltransferase family 39 protein [Candidatus Levybacteria bacterium]|nr:glycosyltransferase family 39 protein [Candidatus Levybacteria bacterium]
MGKNLLALLTIVLFVLLATFPLLHKGFPPTHDGEYHVIRFYEFYKTLASGVLYPRWAEDLNNGYGIPLFNYVYPLPNYIAAFLHALGFSFIDSFKYSLILATGIGAVAFYFFAKYFTNRLGGLVGALIYIFTPYRFVDIYVRGSIGEVWSLAILPLLLWSLAILIKEGKVSYIGLTSFLLAFLIFSHNILAILFSPFLFTYAIVLIMQAKNRQKSFYKTVVALMLGVGISAIFWLPAIAEKKYVRGLEVFDYKTYFPDLTSLLFPSWGTGFAGDIASGMSTQIGLVNLLIVCLSLRLAFQFFKKQHKIFFFTIVWFFAVVILMLPLSSHIWDAIPFFHFVQFPWRYLSLVIILCAFLAAMLVSVVRWKKLLSIILVGLAVVTTMSYTKPAYYHDRDDAHYISRDNFISGTNSPGNAFNTVWIGSPLMKKSKKTEVLSGQEDIRSEIITPEQYVFKVTTSKPAEAIVNTAFFPGWEAKISGKSLTLRRTETGVMKLSLPKGNYFVTMEFVDTMVRRVGVFITLFSVVLAGATTGFALFRVHTR